MRLTLVAFGLAFGLVVAEVALQLAPTSFVSYPLYEPSEHLGTMLRANQEGWQTTEGRVYVRTNRHGFRDLEYSHTKPAKSFRIAVLGDSYTEAAQVDIKKTFWSILGRELESCLPDGYENVEVLNFGVSSYGTAQELLMLRHDVWQFDPDLVLLAFLPANDIRNNSKELEPQKRRPFFVLENGQLTLDHSFRETPEWQRRRESFSTQFQAWAIRRFELCALLHRLRRSDQRSQEQAGQRHIEAGLSAQAYYPPRNEVWKRAWEITERLIVKMHEEVTEREIPFVVMSVTSGVVVRPESQARAELREDLGVPDLFYPDRWIAQLGEEHGFPVVLLSEQMQEYAKKRDVYFHGFENTQPGTGHWNETGHAFAGKRAADVICDQVLLPRSE